MSRSSRLEDAVRLAHGRLDVERLDVLPLIRDVKISIALVTNRNPDLGLTCFFKSETRKLMASMTLATNWSSLISTWPTATPKHKTFFNWKRMVCVDGHKSASPCQTRRHKPCTTHRADIIDLVAQVFGVRDGRRELAGL